MTLADGLGLIRGEFGKFRECSLGKIYDATR